MSNQGSAKPQAYQLTCAKLGLYSERSERHVAQRQVRRVVSLAQRARQARQVDEHFPRGSCLVSRVSCLVVIKTIAPSPQQTNKQTPFVRVHKIYFVSIFVFVQYSSRESRMCVLVLPTLGLCLMQLIQSWPNIIPKSVRSARPRWSIFILPPFVFI